MNFILIKIYFLKDGANELAQQVSVFAAKLATRV